MPDRAENSALRAALPYAPLSTQAPGPERRHIRLTFYWQDWYYDAFVSDPIGLNKLDPAGPFSRQARYYPASGNEPALLIFAKPYAIRDNPVRSVGRPGLEIVQKHGVPAQLSRP